MERKKSYERLFAAMMFATFCGWEMWCTIHNLDYKYIIRQTNLSYLLKTHNSCSSTTYCKMGKQAMEQWPPRPSTKVTPNTNGIVQQAIKLGTKSYSGTSMNQPMELGEKESVMRGAIQRKLGMTTEPTKKWGNFFDTCLSAKGMSLSYVTPVMKNEEKVI